MGPIILLVIVLFLHSCVSNDALVRVVAAYGKVQEISPAFIQDYPEIQTTSTHINMTTMGGKPLPNILRVGGHRVHFDYRGVRRVCQRVFSNTV